MVQTDMQKASERFKKGQLAIAQYVETGTKVNELVAIDHPMIFKLLELKQMREPVDVLSDSQLSAKQDETHEICSSQSQRWAKAQAVTTCEDFKQTCQTN